MFTAYSAWLETGSERVMGDIAVNQPLLGLFGIPGSDADWKGGAARQAAMLKPTRAAAARRTEILTQFQQRLLSAWGANPTSESCKIARGRGGKEAPITTLVSRI